MPTKTTRSLKHEYALFIEQEIENYKESIPRSAILAIGDEAAAKLADAAQFALTELLLCEEVDRIISRRLRLPAFSTWKKRRVKLVAEMRRPEHWGLDADDAVVRTIDAELPNNAHVLVAGEQTEKSALFLAANGCEVTALQLELESLYRMIEAAEQAGLASRVHAMSNGLHQWVPDTPLHAVVCSHATLNALSPADRVRVLTVLKTATLDGGMHLVKTILAGSAIDELRATYKGWDVSVERRGKEQVFLARKDPVIAGVAH